MKVFEYLSSKRASGDLLEKKYKRALKKLPLTTAVFCILIAGVIFGAAKFPQNTVDIISSDSFVEYERSALGNAVTNILNNGIVADNELGYTEKTEEGIKVVSKNGECLLPEDASNINITEKGVFYRDNTDITYCFVNYNADESKVILNDPCGNCIVANNSDLYVIKFSKDSHVCSYDLNGKNEKEVIDEPVRSFALLENNIFYLDYNNNLVKMDNEGNREYSLKNVDKFYLNGDLFIQNNDKVIRTNLNNENGEIIAEGIENLLGVTDKSIYYSRDGKVLERNIEDGKETVLSEGKDYYDGVYKNNGKVIAVGEDL